ncbi:MAG: hypothetical protein ABIO29_06590 [Sphingomicrobium sp.]
MTKLTIAFAGAAVLALAGCNSSTNDAAVNDTAVNVASEDINAGADAAASDAANAEAVALGTQEQQLEQENSAAANPSDAEEQNVAGM